MKKMICYGIILLLSLLIAHDVFLAVMHLTVGEKLYNRPGFVFFMTFNGIIYFLGILLLLLYFRYKGYQLSFSAGCLHALTSLFHVVILYNAYTKPGFENWFYISFTATQLSLLLFGISIPISANREQSWLKSYGITLIFLQTIHNAIIILYFRFADYLLQPVLEQVSFWLGLGLSASYGLLLLNFMSEIGKLKSPDRTRMSFKWVSGGSGLLLTACSIYLGHQVSIQDMSPVKPRIPSAKETAIASRFEAHSFINSKGDTLLYRLTLPFNYKPDTSYPLALCLHHGGAHGNDNVVQVESSYAPFLSGYMMRRKYPAFLLVPQCPVGKVWWTQDIDLSITELILSLEKQYNIDARRRYVLGLSGGGYGSWHFIGNHPELFAAAIPVCGKGNERLANSMKDVKIWTFHGSEDILVDVNETRKMVDALKKIGHDVRYTEFAGLGHNIDDQVRGTSGLWDWLFAQKRD